MKDFEGVVDQDKAEEDAKKLLSGRFTMRDFIDQIRMVRKMGSLKDLLEKMPFLGEMTEQLNPDEKELDKIEALFNSMTEQERADPRRIDKSRAGRIAKGSGRKPEEVQELLLKFNGMQQMMGAIGQDPGILGRLPFFKQLGQLNQMKNMDLGAMFGKDPLMAQAMGMGGPGGMPMQMPQLAPGYTAPMSQAQMAKARLAGLLDGPAEGRHERRRARRASRSPQAREGEQEEEPQEAAERRATDRPAPEPATEGSRPSRERSPRSGRASYAARPSSRALPIAISRARAPDLGPVHHHRLADHHVDGVEAHEAEHRLQVRHLEVEAGVERAGAVGAVAGGEDHGAPALEQALELAVGELEGEPALHHGVDPPLEHPRHAEVPHRAC